MHFYTKCCKNKVKSDPGFFSTSTAIKVKFRIKDRIWVRVAICLLANKQSIVHPVYILKHIKNSPNLKFNVLFTEEHQIYLDTQK